jgi:hypothetical protein
VDYYHDDRIHDALEKDTPDHRAVEPKPSAHAAALFTARAIFITVTPGATRRRIPPQVMALFGLAFAVSDG